MDYIGDELDLFQHATNWKVYWSNYIRPYISGRTLEVGAGLGGNIDYLISTADSYTALEPDKLLAAKILETQPDIKNDKLKVISGTLDDLNTSELYDTILYIDVMEHIDNDHAEFQNAASHLSPGGHLIILCPAHQYLFSPFDSAVGHFRRHTKRSFKDLASPHPSLKKKKLSYLDSMGLFASLANKWFLKASMPTKKQISFWDNTIVPISKVTDTLSLKMFGKTVIGVWQRE